MACYCLGKKEYHLIICDHILDNSYGQIGLTEVERKIERLPLFKRLHSVSQLGLVNWVFPCALHTRYTHSIGVMHVAGQMAEHINANKGYAFFSDAEIQIIRLAGMLHDLGHYPLSHNVEQVYKDINSDRVRRLANESVNEHLESYVNCPNFLNPSMRNAPPLTAGKLRDKFSETFSGSKDFHHEAIGNLLITKNDSIFKVIKKYFVLMPDPENPCGPPVLNRFFAKYTKKGKLKSSYSEEDVEEITKQLLTMIGSMVIGKYSYDETQTSWTDKYSAMIQLIHSELDADNLDYLLRDASFSGTSYGIMDMSVLMNCLTVTDFEYKNTKDGSTKHRYVVGIKPKGIGCVEQFLINKYLAYSQMTFSKYVSVLEAMLSQIAKEWLNSDKDYKPVELAKMVSDTETSEDFLLFTDSFILGKIFNLSSNGSMLSSLPKHIVSYLKNYSAFNLCDTYGTGKSECVCAGTKEDEIIECMEQSEVYKRFADLCGRIGSYNGEKLKNSAEESQLFTFRFEKYNLTKQLPRDVFNTTYEIDTGVENTEQKYDLHYFRIGNGIPILEEEKHYRIHCSDKTVACCELPDLSVDCPQSVLRKLYSLQFVCLREYVVDDYVYNI